MKALHYSLLQGIKYVSKLIGQQA